VLPLLEHHDRARFELTCYADVAVEDAFTAALRNACARWRATAGLSDDEVFDAIRADSIDLLIDLGGHTAGNRLRVFARRPAPLSATYLGYPGSTGLSSIDFRITDSIADPPGSESLHAERLVRIDPVFLCYRLASDLPPVAPSPAQRNGFVTFGCFNNLAKVSDATISAWMGVLDAVPGSRLVLKSLAFTDPGTIELTRRRFAANGLESDAARVEFLSPRPSHLEHLRAYDRIDIALDTLGYNGTTTTCEALSMGVPVVALAGEAHASRVGASLLGSIGCADWAAKDVDGFVRLASALASDLPALAQTRATLRNRLARSSLCDQTAFVRRMEQAWVEMISASSASEQL
jgi:predicted O-linked N-acetylglucosamine transferase (SPINDLY family)